MKKIKRFLLKYGTSAMAGFLTFAATQAATRGCCSILYQPKVPENLKDFSKNK